MLESTVKSVGPIVAALWIAWQYAQSQADKRVEASLAYVTRFEDGKSSVGRAQRGLTRALWTRADEIDELKHTKATAEQLKTIRNNIVSRVIASSVEGSGGKEGFGPIEELDSFYSALATCIQGNVCDEAAALRFFGCSSKDFVSNFGDVIRSRQMLANRFGWGATWLSQRAREQKSCGP